MKPVCFLLFVSLSVQLHAQIDNVLLVNTQKHLFSNSTVTDLFTLRVVGSSLLKGRAYFTIVDGNGKQVYQQSFEAIDLLGDLDLETPKAKEDTIRERVAHFFGKEQFIKPAIKPNQAFDAHYSDKQAWTEVKANPAAIGFIYSYGYEGTYFVAYSKKRRKAVIYFSSD